MFIHYELQPLLRSGVHEVPYEEGQNEIPLSLSPITSIGKRIPPPTIVQIRKIYPEIVLFCSW